MLWSDLLRDGGFIEVSGCMWQVRAEEATVDDGSGEVKVWRIEKLEKAEVPKGEELRGAM